MKKHIRNIYLLLTLSFIFSQLFAQDDDYSRERDKPEKPKTEKKKKPADDSKADNYVFGGGLGLQLGNPTYIEFSPKLGYRLIENALIGGGISYVYYSENQGIYGKLKTSIYGGSLFGSYEPIENVFGWAEYEMLNFEYYNYNINDYSRKWFASPFVGLGYRQPIGDKGFIQILLLYNLNYTSDSPYTSPFIQRISFFL